jgi:hypothetical protein
MRSGWDGGVVCRITLNKIFNSIPVTTMTRITAKAMLPPSYHPSLIPYKSKMKNKKDITS